MAIFFLACRFVYAFLLPSGWALSGYFCIPRASRSAQGAFVWASFPLLSVPPANIRPLVSAKSLLIVSRPYERVPCLCSETSSVHYCPVALALFASICALLESCWLPGMRTALCQPLRSSFPHSPQPPSWGCCLWAIRGALGCLKSSVLRRSGVTDTLPLLHNYLSSYQSNIVCTHWLTEILVKYFSCSPSSSSPVDTKWSVLRGNSDICW